MTKVFNRLFVTWFRFRKGKVKLRGAPSLILHTVGARTGQPRQTPLLYLPEADSSMAIVGSNGGDDRTPGWVHNLLQRPEVDVEVDGERRRMEARLADPETRRLLWPRLVTMYRSYDTYQSRTTREIPVIILTER